MYIILLLCQILTWHFCGEKNTKKIEKIQERALRFIYRDYDSSYESLLLKSQLPSLKVRRLRAIALEAFKILNNLSPVYLNDLLTFKNLSYSFRYTQTVEIPQVRTSRYGTRCGTTSHNISGTLQVTMFSKTRLIHGAERSVCVRFVQTFKF